MNYYQARQRKDGRWDFTCKNDDRVWPAGLCAQHTDGHATAVEAEQHFYDGEVAGLREYEVLDQQLKCAVCGAWTGKGLRARHLGEVMLCDTHRMPAGFTQAHPFAPGIQIVSSW